MPFPRNEALLKHLQQHQAVVLVAYSSKPRSGFAMMDMERALEGMNASICFALRAFCSATEAQQLIHQTVSYSTSVGNHAAEDRQVCRPAFGQTIQDIEDEFALLTQALEQRRRTLIQTVTEVALTKSKQLDKQRERLESFLSACYEALHNAIDALQRASNDTDRRLASLVPHFDRLVELAAERHFAGTVVEPSIRVSFKKSLRGSILTHGSPVFPGRVAQRKRRVSEDERKFSPRLDAWSSHLREPAHQNQLTHEFESNHRLGRRGSMKIGTHPWGWMGNRGSPEDPEDSLAKTKMAKAIRSSELALLHKVLNKAGSQVIDDTVGQRSLMQYAASNGHATAIAFLARMGSQLLDTPDQQGRTPMYLAARGGHLDAIEALFQAGSQSLDTPASNSWTPLHVAAERGFSEVIERLISLGSQALDSSDGNGTTPVHIAAFFHRRKVLDVLYRLGSKSLLAVDHLGLTPLDYAVMGGHVETIEQLVRLDQRVTIQNRGQGSLLHLAVAGGHSEVIETLVRLGCDLNERAGRSTSMHIALEHGKLEVIETLVNLGSQAIDSPDLLGRTPMHIAACRGNQTAIKELVRLGSQALDSLDRAGRSPLAMAARREYDKAKTIECMQLLRALGANQNIERVGLKAFCVKTLKAPLSEDDVASVRFPIYFAQSLTVRLLSALKMKTPFVPNKRVVFEEEPN